MSKVLRVGCRESCSKLLEGEFAKFYLSIWGGGGELINNPLHFSLFSQKSSAPSCSKAWWFLSPSMLRAIRWPDCAEIIPSIARYTPARMPHPLSTEIDTKGPILQMGKLSLDLPTSC